MFDPASRLPARPSLEQLRKQAKELGHAEGIPLAEAQFRLAKRYGFESWPKLVHHVETVRGRRLEQFERLAEQLAAAYSAGDATAIRELNGQQGTSFVWDHEPVTMQRRLSTWFASPARTPELALADARQLVARSYGFASWAEFAESVAQPPGHPRSAPLGQSTSPPFYHIDWEHNTITPRPPLSERDWDTIFAVMKEHRITGIATAAVTDAVMQRLSELDFVTSVNAGGALQLSDEGLQHLARMPQLERLDLSGWHSPLTDRGLQVLRHLKALRQFDMCWAQRVTDGGVANLTFCDRLRSVNLMGTPTGDGAINALRGTRGLRRFKTGKQVTDRGIPLLHDFPVFKASQPVEVAFDLMSFGLESHDLMLDGPFSDAGLASLAGLEGLLGLGFFWHSSGFTGRGLAALAVLPNLIFLGCQGERCDDAAMRAIAAIPKLRMLMGQGTVASDDGFTALSRSRTLEYLWGRECPNLGGRGFAALAALPALKGLGVSCKNVDDASLAALPRFPALRQLMPMDVPDDGFRHVGGCERLEDLWCMYCRDTGDRATEHIAGLGLKSYYAGQTKITDRSLEILGRMHTLEKLEFWDCAGLTDAGVAQLAGLPRLRKVSVEGSPKVSREGMSVFPAAVRAEYR